MHHCAVSEWSATVTPQVRRLIVWHNVVASIESLNANTIHYLTSNTNEIQQEATKCARSAQEDNTGTKTTSL